MHPVLFHVGHLSLPSFGVLAAIGLLGGLALSERTAVRAGVEPAKLWDAGLFVVIAAFCLSRLQLVAANLKSFLAYPLLLLAVPALTPSGLAMTVLATYLWMRWKQLNARRSLEAWAPCALLVWGFLALGHLLEGSDPGLPTNLPWGMRMTDESTSLHPVALYACVYAWTLAGAIYHRAGRGDAAAWALLGAGLGQFLISFMRQPGVELFAGMDALEWIAIAMMVAGWLLLTFRNSRPMHRSLL